MVELLSHHKVLQVLVVCLDLHWVSGFFQEMPPLFQCHDLANRLSHYFFSFSFSFLLFLNIVFLFLFFSFNL